MSGVYGWIGNSQGTVQVEDVLNMMSSAFDAGPGRHTDRVSAIGGSLALSPGIVPTTMHHADAITVGLVGQVRWLAAGLETHARREGDAGAILQGYRDHGDALLAHMSGPFAFALVDSRNRRGLLAVDRMGIRTMCYANPSGCLVFGSTAESVASHPDVGDSLNTQAIFNYLFCHVVPSPGTIFGSVCKLQPGEYVSFRDGVVQRRFYWQLQYADHGAESLPELERRFHAIVRDVTASAVDGVDQVGAFLSGGTDSSTIAGLLTELRGEPVDTFSIGFAAEGFDEMEYARITSRHFGTRAHEYYVTPEDVVQAIPLVAAKYDEPFGNASAVPTYLCAKLGHANGMRVMLAGDGGDEIFGGNARYAKQKVFEAYWLAPRAVRKGLLEPLLLGVPGGDRLPPLRKARSYLRQAAVPLPERLETYNFLNRGPLADVFEAGFLDAVDTGEPVQLQRDAYFRATSTSPVNRMMHLDLKFTLADNDLRKVSRMSELAGVEVRYPLIDERLVEFAGQLPPALKVRRFMLRYFFKHALRDFLPPETLAKSKHGFGLPFGIWLAQHRPLAELAHESVQAFGRRGIVRRDYIGKLLEHHTTNHASYFGVMIWVIMMLEQWLASRGK